MGIGLTEGLLIAAIIILLFGSKKLPELGKGMGEAIKNFKKGMNEGAGEDKTDSTKSENDKKNS
jgi:sec-independent protein translocase protein TatA